MWRKGERLVAWVATAVVSGELMVVGGNRIRGQRAADSSRHEQQRKRTGKSRKCAFDLSDRR